MRGGTDIVGYIASGLVLLTFTTKEMRSLRIMAILSNLAFIAYGLLDEILPVLALHVILFPLNVFRLAQLEIAKARVQEAPHREASPEIVSPQLFVGATGAIVARAARELRQRLTAACDAAHRPLSLPSSGRVISIGLMVLGGGIIVTAGRVSLDVGVPLVLGGLGAMVLGVGLLPRSVLLRRGQGHTRPEPWHGDRLGVGEQPHGLSLVWPRRSRYVGPVEQQAKRQ